MLCINMQIFDIKGVWLILIFILLIFMSPGRALGQEPLKPIRTDNPPVIDGVLDEPLWREAPGITGFKTFNPDFGSDMSEKTIVYYAYDYENIYFAFRCYDSEPDKIKTSVTSRDNIRPDDWVCINIDTFNDQQSLYTLYINPAGIQGDAIFVNGEEDASVDIVWYSAGVINDEGYTVEVQVPFKSIRFTNSNPVEMAVIFERRINRRSENGTYPAMNPEQGMFFLTQTKEIVYHDVRHYTLFELLPAVTYGTRKSATAGRLESEGSESDISLTTKYGITSHLVLDGTLNPDFSQVEADAGQVDINLRYALFFPEKRPFFLEGKEHFNFSGCGEYIPLRAIVHTRKISDPAAGAKITGKIGRDNTIASIYAMDDLSDEGNSESSDDYAHFSIFRYKRALSQDSYIGGIYTGREQGGKYNRVLGTDGSIRTGRASMIGYHAIMSKTRASEQNPVQDGHSAAANFEYETRNMSLWVEALDISKNFRTDTGYLTRSGISTGKVHFAPKFYPKSRLMPRVEVRMLAEYSNDKFSDMWEYYNFVELGLMLLRNSQIEMTLTKATEVYAGERFDIGGITLRGSSQITKQFFFNLSYEHKDKIYYSDVPYQGYGSDISGGFNYQPSDKFHSALNLTYSDFCRESDSGKIYDYTILRSKNTYQVNKYLFFRGIVEYNSYRKELLTDLLASFTYIPGTVIHAGYGSTYEKIKWVNDRYVDSVRFMETRRGFFFKASYLWRL